MARRRTDERSADDKIVQTAKERFRRCEDWESSFRRLFVDDLKFANGDSDNHWQWPDALRRMREVDRRPCLTINKTRQHNLQIINDAKQNKPGVVVHPVSTEATYESAQMFEGVVRHVEYVSNAQAAYDTATEFQVEGGIGYWRVVTDYEGDDSFDQEIFIRRIKDPLSVYLDPDIKEADGSDARFGFVFDDLTIDEFKRRYPNQEELVAKAPFGNGTDWLGKDHIRVAEYYYCETQNDTLAAMQDPDGSVRMIRLSDLDEKAASEIRKSDAIPKRALEQTIVRWCLIAGDKIIDRRDWPGKYVPIVRCVGEEEVIEGKLVRKGHTRALKDPQRMYNYGTSACVEFIALQGKQPYIAPTQAIEGFENYWATANTDNHSYLPYNAVDEQGNQVPMPQRQQPPTAAPAYLTMMQNAAEEMRMVSGQYDAMMGAPSNETSGKAINQRQRQGDRATYHFIDNQARAIRFTGKILIDLIPKVYDTRRVIRILGKDGDEDSIVVDPQANAPVGEDKDELTGDVQKIFNPAVGRYDVTADVGPAYQTRREEAFDALTQIASNNPQMMTVAGDLIMKAADFPMADELAERLERMVPPYVKGEAPPPELIQMQQQLQQQQQVLQQMTEALANEETKRSIEKEQKQIDVYKAETDRLKVMGGAVDPNQVAQLAAQLVLQILQTGTPQPTLQPQHPTQPPQGGFFSPDTGLSQ